MERKLGVGLDIFVVIEAVVAVSSSDFLKLESFTGLVLSLLRRSFVGEASIIDVGGSLKGLSTKVPKLGVGCCACGSKTF